MSNMSVITSRTSILKNYVPTNRNNVKHAISNRVRFELLANRNLRIVLQDAANKENLKSYEEYLMMIKDPQISEKDFLAAVQESRQCVELLKPKFTVFVEALLSLDWLCRSDEAILEYQKFLIDLLSAHNKYTSFAIQKLVGKWIPREVDQLLWLNGCPADTVKSSLQYVHETISVVLDVIPMSLHMVIDAIDKQFPYFKKSSFVIAGYVHNVFWLLEYRPLFKEDLIRMIIKKLILMDVNVPRNEIELSESEDQNMQHDEDIFQMDAEYTEIKVYGKDEMKNVLAETLDLCMEKLFLYIEQDYKTIVNQSLMYKILVSNFESIIMPTHNSHHVQFVMFYFCSFKLSIAESFLNMCWSKVCDPNIAPPIRQSAVCYINSLLARAQYVPIGLIKGTLQEMCAWTHQYIQRCDTGQNVNSLRAHTVFYAVCQAVFYVIAFRSRDLTNGIKNLQFLQSLQLWTIVSCHLNPLRVCLPAVATAFAGVTRSHQLAYCHTILERNARKKLATIYSNDTSMPEESLETYFPFDPYLLKKSGKRISPIYLQYQASDVEETDPITSFGSRRKHLDSVSNPDDIDDFIVDKKLRLSSSIDKEMLFSYGTSPGFHH